MEDSSHEHTLADPRLLETIDKLFELNIGEYVALPQLLVVGDQSSGKSSVLEGLTGLPFPRDSGLCTRFATQITFRRTSVKKISISVIPAASADEDYCDKLRAWKKVDLETLKREEFAAVLKEAQKLMGVGLPTEPGKRTFSSDVLKIEICGAEQQHLSVVDVPGIFRKITEGVTTHSDKMMVRDMIVSYMKNPRSIILAVVPANVDVATQDILDMAEEIDNKKQRTLGVLTKPDIVDTGAHHDVNKLIDGASHSLALGWYMVRNPGQADLKNVSWDRHAEEESFFKTDARYKSLPKDRVGIPALRSRLGEILADIVRREFPHVKSEINNQLKDRRRLLNDLGASRDTKEQQHKYLLELAARFQDLAKLALNAHYGVDDIFDKFPKLKLATLVIRRNDVFSKDVALRGHAIKFSTQAEAEDSEDVYAAEPQAIDARSDAAMSMSHFGDDPESQECGVGDPGITSASEIEHETPLLLLTPEPETANRYTHDHGELDDLIQPISKVAEPKSTDIIEWLGDIYHGSRGFELGTFDASILPIIWKKLTVNWDDLTLGYIYDIVSIVHSFILGLLKICCTDERVLSGLLPLLMSQMTLRYENAINQAKSLLRVEKDGNLLTCNHYFNDNLEKCRQQRIKEHVERHAVIVTGYQEKLVPVSRIVNDHPMGNAEHTIRDLHDILRSYYKVARKRFVDNVCKQAADDYLIAGPDTPIKIFSPAFVIGLEPQQVE